MIYGLGAALGWGISEFGAAFVARRIGSLRTTVVAQVTSVAALGALALVARPPWDVTAAQVGWLVLNGAVAAAAYASVFHGLRLGPVALVAPLGAAYGAVTVVLAVALFREPVSGTVAAGIAATLLGAVLTATDVRSLGRSGLAGPGVPFGAAATLLFGVAALILGRVGQQVGWLVALAISRSAGSLLLVGALLVQGRPQGPANGSGLSGAVAVGLADVLGTGMYVRGAELGLISVVVTASATFTLIPVLGGVALLRERPAPSQWAGVALVVVGLLVLGLRG